MSVVKHIKQHKVLLDTHIWIWLMNGDPKLPSSFRSNIEKCRAQENVLISAISVWEVGMLVEKGRIALDMDRLDWVERALDLPGIHLVPISPRIAIQSTRLPAEVHGDPADRLLVSTARDQNAVLVTHDKQLLAFGKKKFVNVHFPAS